MTTMTIHADDAFAYALREYAAHLGKSINQTVKDVFTPILGLAAKGDEITSPWDKFYGVAPDIDTDFWNHSTAVQREIDPELWK